MTACILLSLLLFGGIYAMLQVSVLRHPVPDLSNPQVLKMTKWKKYAPQIAKGVAWFKSHEMEDVEVVSFDGKRLAGHFVPHENAKGTVVLMHGYRSSYVLDFSCALEFYYGQGFNLLICDQRAHNKSQGLVITFGVKERYDVVSWTTYLATIFGDDHPIYLVGLSMGASTVLMSADRGHTANIRGMVADCGFTSPEAIMSHVAQNHMHLPAKVFIPILNALTTLFCGFSLHEVSTTEALKNTDIPVVLVHGTDDTFVPSFMSEENYAACKSEKHLLLVPGASHGMAYLVDPEDYEKLVTNFLETHLENEKIPNG